MKLLHDLVEAVDVLMRHYGLRRKDLVERRTMIGGNPWLAQSMPHRYVTRHCRNLECDTCPSTEHQLYCTHWCHYEEEQEMSKLFTARYRGYCRTCRDDIEEGEEMGYDSDDQIVCRDCWTEDQEAHGFPDYEDEDEDPIRSDWRKKR